MKTATHIQKSIGQIPVGEPFLSTRFLSYGSRASIDQALSRMAKAGQIARVARGVFVRPKMNRFVGVVLPEPIKVAEAIAKATGTVVQVHGAEAARRFGLTTQMPVKPIYYTSGASRRFKVGVIEVTLRHVTQRKLTLGGRPAGMALAALWYLGKEAVNDDVVRKIAGQLAPSEFEALKSETSAMPAWMADVFRRFESGRLHG